MLSVAFTVIGVCLVSFSSSQGNHCYSHSNSTGLFVDTEGAELQCDHQENRSTPIGYVVIAVFLVLDGSCYDCASVSSIITD